VSTNAPLAVPTLHTTFTNAPLDTLVDTPSFTPTTEHVLQREISSSLQRESSNNSQGENPDESDIHPPHGWNHSHPYNTRFKQRFHANSASISQAIEQTASLDHATITALLSTHDHLPSPNKNILHDHPYLAFGAQSNPDILHFGGMQHAPDRSDFEKDMVREITDFFDQGCIKIVPRSTVPPDEKPVQAIWSFRRKRAPDWTVTKYRSRLCPHGGQQIEGLNFWDTYAPVVSWRTIRLTLVLSLLSNLKTRQLDYVGAFPQADADCEVYMNIPPGFIVDNNRLIFTRDSTKHNSKHHVLKVLKNIYGLRQAGNVWFDKLRDSLLCRGFTQSQIDPCLFYRKDCIFIVYVDDCLLFSPSDTVLDNLINSLQSEFKLTHEGDVGAYLGIDIKRHQNGSMELSQPGLIQKIISAAGLEENSATHDTPVTTLLHDDTTGPDREHTWNYRAVIGMLNYLASSTRPDIAFAVHQCARFCAHPKRSHELAIRRIVRYLKSTANKGYFLRPTIPKYTLDCYVDADFAGLWTQNTACDPISVKSRTGYVITFASCPLLWSSKLQSEIALSTTEAEYIALSQATRDLIPMRALLNEFASVTKLIVGPTTTYSTIFEDNKGCVELTNAPRLRPRTRHIGIKYHHFRSHVARGEIKVQWIDTKHQLADIFTKPLPASAFKYLRNLLLGW
jgi:hypothetical protein